MNKGKDNTDNRKRKASDTDQRPSKYKQLEIITGGYVSNVDKEEEETSNPKKSYSGQNDNGVSKTHNANTNKPSNSSNDTNKSYNKDQPQNTSKYNNTNNTSRRPDTNSNSNSNNTTSSAPSSSSLGEDKYVKMPYNPKNTMTCPTTKDKKPKWEVIIDTLMKPITSSKELKEAVLVYNSTYEDDWTFNGLHLLLNHKMDQDEREQIFSYTIPGIIQLALALPELMGDDRIPILAVNVQRTLLLSQHQIASLLANAFLCTFPRRNAVIRNADLPTINFSALFGCTNESALNKMRCLFNYFNRVIKDVGEGSVSFHRRVINKFPDWQNLSKQLDGLVVHAEGAIEDSDPNFLHVDFSNKYIGGGVLSRGCVQEEIMFCIYPELIASRLFTEVMRDNECCIITGAERYSSYSGYADSFRFEGDFKDKTPRDEQGRRIVKIVAMDAMEFTHSRKQFNLKCIERELNKCYCAFVSPIHPARPVASGNWGCGAFNGSLELKALIQLMAAAACSRELQYYTFDNVPFAQSLESMWNFLQANNVSVGALCNSLLVYCDEYHKKNDEKMMDTYSVFQFLQSYLA